MGESIEIKVGNKTYREIVLGGDGLYDGNRRVVVDALGHIFTQTIMFQNRGLGEEENFIGPRQAIVKAIQNLNTFQRSNFNGFFLYDTDLTVRRDGLLPSNDWVEYRTTASVSLQLCRYRLASDRKKKKS